MPIVNSVATGTHGFNRIGDGTVKAGPGLWGGGAGHIIRAMIIRVFGWALVVVGLTGCGQGRERAAAAGEGDGGAAPFSRRVMTFNLWHGGEAGGQPLSQSVEVIKAAGADVVGVQETGGQAPRGRPRPDHGARIAE